jgi:hypothetical protein
VAANLNILFTVKKNGKEYSAEELKNAADNISIPQYFRNYKLAEIYYLKKDYPSALASIINALNFPQAHIPEILELAYYILTASNNSTDAKKYILEAVELSEDKSKYNALLQKIN